MDTMLMHFFFKQSARNQVAIPTPHYLSENQFACIPSSAFIHHTPTFWTRLKDGINIVIFLSGMTFGINYLYKVIRIFISFINTCIHIENKNLFLYLILMI